MNLDVNTPAKVKWHTPKRQVTHNYFRLLLSYRLYFCRTYVVKSRVFDLDKSNNTCSCAPNCKINSTILSNILLKLFKPTLKF